MVVFLCSELCELRRRRHHPRRRRHRLLLSAGIDGRWSSTSPTSGSASSTRSPTTRRSSAATAASPTPRPTSARTGSRTRSPARGIGPGDHVALYLYNGTEYLEAMLAAFKLRAVPINVNYRYVEDELRYLLDDADAKAVVFHREFAPKLAAIRADLPAAHARSSRSTTTPAPTSPRSARVEYEAALAAASPDARLRRRARPTTSTSSTPAAPPACRRA